MASPGGGEARVAALGNLEERQLPPATPMYTERSLQAGAGLQPRTPCRLPLGSQNGPRR